jgi:hypothetical protein
MKLTLSITKMVRNSALIATAVATTKIGAKMLGGLIVTGVLIAELSPSESQYLAAYRVTMIYCGLELGVIIASGIAIYLAAKRTLRRTLLNTYGVVALVVFGTHLSFAYIFSVGNPVLAEFVIRSAWVPVFGLAVAATLFMTEKMIPGWLKGL